VTGGSEAATTFCRYHHTGRFPMKAIFADTSDVIWDVALDPQHLRASRGMAWSAMA